MTEEYRSTQDYVTTKEQTTDYENANVVKLSGRLENDFSYSHSSYGKSFYESKLMVLRRSKVADHIPLVIARYLKPKENCKGKVVELEGSLRSINTIGEDGRNHLVVYVYAHQINFYDNESELVEDMDVNSIHLEGYLSKKPTIRGTPFGRVISELMVNVERCYGKSSNIPCIAWGDLAFKAQTMSEGAKVILDGRIQSRVYCKEEKEKEVYEVSAFFLSAE